MSPLVMGDQRVRDLLREASEWRLISVLFERPHGAWWRAVASLAQGCADGELAAAAAGAPRATEGGFLATLGPGGQVPAREVGHRVMTDPGHVLADLEAFYRAFAYAPETEEPPDHVSVEAGFVGYMRLKEAYAVARADTEGAQVVADAAALFVEAHLSTLGEPLVRRLDAVGGGYLAGAARALERRAGRTA